MNQNNQLPPNPQNAILKRIYPWDEYNMKMVVQWLYHQAQKTGFIGTFEDFNQRYGAYIASADPEDFFDIIDTYKGPYHIIPQENLQQVLNTANKMLNQDIVIEPAPIFPYRDYHGRYTVTPLVNIDQALRTKDHVLYEDIIVERIPYKEVSNDAGGVTIIIGGGDT